MTPLPISVIVPVFHGGTKFRECVDSIVAALRDGDEGIVVSDGEGDGSWRYAREAGLRVVVRDSNAGPATARNDGARAAKADFLFFVDADVTLPPDALEIVAGVFGSEPDVAALLGSYDEEPAETNFLSQFKNLFHHFVHQGNGPEANTFWGACGAIKRKIFFEVGGFDESFGNPSVEDIELGYRISGCGHRIRLVRELQVKHLKKWTPYSLVRTDFSCRAEPWTRLIWRSVWGGRKLTADLNLGPSFRLSMAVSCLLVAAAVGMFFVPWLAMAAAALGVAFLLINSSFLNFFRTRRGLKFAAGAGVWRFTYDLYSVAGFCYGSSVSARRAMGRIGLLSFARIDPVALGIAVGALWGCGVAAATLILVAKGGAHVGPMLGLLNQYWPGYSVTWAGSMVGLAWGFGSGWLFGFCFASLRNTLFRMHLASLKVQAGLSRMLAPRADAT